jgi:aarF domain-containing kinase
VTREELARVVMSLGLQRFDPIISSFTLPGFRRPVSLVPTVTREDEVVLNNVRRIMAFLAAGSPASRTLSAQVRGWVCPC